MKSQAARRNLLAIEVVKTWNRLPAEDADSFRRLHKHLSLMIC